MGVGRGVAKKLRGVLMELDSSKSTCLIICGSENLSSCTGSGAYLLVHQYILVR